MLASITPLGERGRRSTWGVTVTAFAIGATVAAGALGAVLGSIGSAVLEAVSAKPRLITLALVLAVAAMLDLRRARVPGPIRQVDERWLDQFRGWVYGLGYGAQLGIGLTTVVSSAATYVAVVAATLSGSALRGAVVLGCFGLTRGLTPLATARIEDPARLMNMHAWLERVRGPVRRGVALVLMAGLAAATIGAFT